MKYCPTCNKQYTETWITFCSDDGTVLVEELSPARDPHWDPRIQTPPVDTPSEQPTAWLPPQPQNPGGWVAPDQRPPMRPAWQPPPAPLARPSAPSQGLAVASMIVGIIGMFAGWICLGPVPGIVGLVLGLVSLSQIKKHPEKNGGKPFAIIGTITGGLSLLFYGALFLYFIIASIVFN
jgi:hypothetical protein